MEHKKGSAGFAGAIFLRIRPIRQLTDVNMGRPVESYKATVQNAGICRRLF